MLNNNNNNDIELNIKISNNLPNYSLPKWSLNSNEISNPIFIEIIQSGTIINNFYLKNKNFFIIGRNKNNCDILINNNSSISRNHSILQYSNDESLFLYDLNSTHGTYLNNQKIEPFKYYKLNNGDVFQFGKSSKIFVCNFNENFNENENENLNENLNENENFSIKNKN